MRISFTVLTKRKTPFGALPPKGVFFFSACRPYPVRQATCRCSLPLHLLRRTIRMTKYQTSTSPPFSIEWSGAGQRFQYSIFRHKRTSSALDFCGHSHIIKVGMTESNQTLASPKEEPPSELLSPKGVFFFSACCPYPVRQATCRCSLPLHLLRRTIRMTKYQTSTSPPFSIEWSGAGQRFQYSIFRHKRTAFLQKRQ